MSVKASLRQQDCIAASLGSLSPMRRDVATLWRWGMAGGSRAFGEAKHENHLSTRCTSSSMQLDGLRLPAREAGAEAGTGGGARAQVQKGKTEYVN